MFRRHQRSLANRSISFSSNRIKEMTSPWDLSQLCVCVWGGFNGDTCHASGDLDTHSKGSFLRSSPRLAFSKADPALSALMSKQTCRSTGLIFSDFLHDAPFRCLHGKSRAFEVPVLTIQASGNFALQYLTFQ